MSVSALRLGHLTTVEEMGLALRDVERKINDIIQQVPTSLDLATGAHMQILARGTDAAWHVWTLQSGGGCTITFNDATHVCTISVP